MSETAPKAVKPVDRIKAEIKAFKESQAKIKAFMESDKYAKLPFSSRVLIQKQLTVTNELINILLKRVASLEA